MSSLQYGLDQTLCKVQSALFPEWLWFAGFSGSEVRAGLGNVCEGLCTSRSLLGSYIHQESI